MASPRILALASEASSKASASPTNVTTNEKDRKSTRLNSSHRTISYAVFCLKTPSTTETYTLSLHDALPISRQDPVRRVEDEQPDDARDGGRDAVRPQQQRAVDGQPANLGVGERGEQQGQRQSDERHHEREHEARERRAQVRVVAEETLEIREPDVDQAIAER